MFDEERTKRKEKTVCTVGSGYAGLPLAKTFVIENKSVKWEDGR